MKHDKMYGKKAGFPERRLNFVFFLGHFLERRG